MKSAPCSSRWWSGTSLCLLFEWSKFFDNFPWGREWAGAWGASFRGLLRVDTRWPPPRKWCWLLSLESSGNRPVPTVWWWLQQQGQQFRRGRPRVRRVRVCKHFFDGLGSLGVCIVCRGSGCSYISINIRCNANCILKLRILLEKLIDPCATHRKRKRSL